MTDSAIKSTIQTQMVATMRAQDKPRLSVIRLIQAAIKQQEVDERILLSDEQMLVLLDKMIRQRKESIKQFEAASRDDLVQKEQFELNVIQEFLPEALSQDALQALIQEAIQSVNAESIRDMSRVMAVLKPQVQGRADMAEVGAMIKNLLAS